MKKPFLALLLLSLPALLLAQPAPAPQAPRPLVFTHVTVLDMTGGPAQPDMAVVIAGERISEIGRSGSVRMPPGAQVVDATGKFLIPGLWDMHVHWFHKDYLSLFIANGVTGIRLKDRSQEDVELGQVIYRKTKDLIGPMRRAGVEILAGTDVLNPYCFPGFSLHDELTLLVEAGLAPMEALQAATLNPARYLGKDKDLGTVEKGKLADLVLLDASPLADIKNTRKIEAVVFNGKLLPKADLQKMLAALEAPAKKE